MRNLTQAFAMKPDDLLPMLYFIHDRGVSKMDLNDFKTVSLIIILIVEIFKECSINI